MKFHYKFSNLLGTVYHKGNLLFTQDGNTLISPVGNRISLYNLKSNTSETLGIESRYNFTTLALSPNGSTLIAVNEAGEALFCSLISRTVFLHYHFKRPIESIKFSPDGKHFAVTKENNLFIYSAPASHAIKYNSFNLEKVFHFSYDKTMCIDWTTDSRVIAVGGADMMTKIYTLENFENLSVYTLGSHTDAIIACFFEENSLDLYTVGKNGQVCVWDCSTDLDRLIPKNTVKQKKPKNDSDNEEDDVVDLSEKVVEDIKEIDTPDRVFYKRAGRHYIKDVLGKEGYVALSSAAYHKKSHLLVTGYSNGSFLLHEMPDCNLIHSLSLSSQVISSIVFNSCGDWIALGCSGIGQLVVWEWQSETFVLKQQGHFNNMQCMSYSPEGLYIVTGGEDAKVKVWNTSTGLCFYTFTAHKSSITGVTFTSNAKVVLSSSLDGTVRAFDMKRYKNFRTFTSPTPTQFSCVTVDPSGEIVCAGSPENFEIFVWSMKNGSLLQVLAGHVAPVSSVSFSSSEAIMVSASWDKTVRIWDIFGSKGSKETVNLISDGLAVAFRPGGLEFAVATLDGQITFFNVHTAEQLGYIEGRNDLYVGRRETDMVTAKKLIKSQAFTSLCYSDDGEWILAAGKSKFICIYQVAERTLRKKIEITCNLSFGAVEDFINRRRMTIFGNKALIEERGDEAAVAIALPGRKDSDMSSRTYKPQIIVSSIQFSPTGRAWAATTTEGLLIYSLNDTLTFDPFDLSIDITPENIRKTLNGSVYLQAILMALRLNEKEIIKEVLESIPVDSIESLAAYIPYIYVEKLLQFLGSRLEHCPHVYLYSVWINHLVISHGIKLKDRALTITGTLCTLKKNLTQHSNSLGKMCVSGTYSTQFLSAMGQIKKLKDDELNNEDILVCNDDEMQSDESFSDNER